MKYSVELTETVISNLKKLSREDKGQILKKIDGIREHPFTYLKKLKGSKLWRLHLGKYRAIIDVLVKGKCLIVLRIGKRDGIY